MQALVYGNGGQESERAKMVLEACGQEVKEFLLVLTLVIGNSEQSLEAKLNTLRLP